MCLNIHTPKTIAGTRTAAMGTKIRRASLPFTPSSPSMLPESRTKCLRMCLLDLQLRLCSTLHYSLNVKLMAEFIGQNT